MANELKNQAMSRVLSTDKLPTGVRICGRRHPGVGGKRWIRHTSAVSSLIDIATSLDFAVDFESIGGYRSIGRGSTRVEVTFCGDDPCDENTYGETIGSIDDDILASLPRIANEADLRRLLAHIDLQRRGSVWNGNTYIKRCFSNTSELFESAR